MHSYRPTLKLRRILLEIAPDVYWLYEITYHKSVKQLIAQCQNKIYGAMTESLLYYKKFRKSIEDEGYKFNPYEPYVSRNIIKGS